MAYTVKKAMKKLKNLPNWMSILNETVSDLKSNVIPNLEMAVTTNDTDTVLKIVHRLKTTFFTLNHKAAFHYCRKTLKRKYFENTRLYYRILDYITDITDIESGIHTTFQKKCTCR